MDHKLVRKFWNNNAEAWTKLARAGYDIYRDHINTPAFLEMLPNVCGLTGLDIGCGEGNNTRLVASLGARMTALDIADVFVHHAKQVEMTEKAGINYLTASAVELPFKTYNFDFATGFMSFMDIYETKQVFVEAFRVLKPGGFLQFSICHPCFDTPHRRNLRNENGLTYAIEVGKYFQELEGDISEWLFSAAPPEIKKDLPLFKTPRFTHTLSHWLNTIISTGFLIEQVAEPCPSPQTIREQPYLQDAQVVAYFLHIRARKPQ